MGKQVEGAKVYNAVRTGLAPSTREVLPVGTNSNIGEIRDVLLNDAYQPVLNEFITNLINRIGLTIVRNKSYNNPLNMFKKGSVPLGTDIQDIYTNPAEAEQYELSNEAMAKLLTINDPDTKVAYYRRNRQDKYTKTIAREALQGAFASWEKFEDFVTSITNSLYSGNYIDEFKYTKDLIDGAYQNNKAIVEIVDKVDDETSATAFVKKCRALYNKITFPSKEYNAYTKFSGAKGEVTTWTDEDRIVLITTADVLAEVDVDVLAKAFNIDNAKFIGRVISVDKFANPEIQAVLCDEAWIQIYENMFRFDEFYNANVMAWNEYLHVWQTYAICPFANAVILATSQKPVDATEVSFADGSTLSMAVDEEKILEVNYKPENAGPIEFATSVQDKVSVTKVDDKHVLVKALATGSSNVTAKVTGQTGVTGTIAITVA